jgi:hypothetical protein
MDHGDIGPGHLKKPSGIGIVQQGEKQMLEGHVPMGPLLGRSSGAPQRMIQICGTRKLLRPRSVLVHGPHHLLSSASHCTPQLCGAQFSESWSLIRNSYERTTVFRLAHFFLEE